MTISSSFAHPREGESFEDFQARYRASIPPVVYLPLAGVSTIEGQVNIEVRETADGQKALLAYSALDRLAECCGPHQPYGVFETSSLETIREQTHYDVVYFDMVIPEELRHPGPQDDAANHSTTGADS